MDSVVDKMIWAPQLAWMAGICGTPEIEELADCGFRCHVQILLFHFVVGSVSLLNQPTFTCATPCFLDMVMVFLQRS